MELYIEVPKSLYKFNLSNSKVLDLLKRYNWDPSKD